MVKVKTDDGKAHRDDVPNDDWTYGDNFEAGGSDGLNKDAAAEPQQEDLKALKKPRKIDHGPKLDSHLLCGSKGLEQIPIIFKNFKSKGKGHELNDLNIMMTKLEHWAYRLYPKLNFDDFLWKMENLGSRKAVQVALHLIREKYTRPKSTDIDADEKIDDHESSIAQTSTQENEDPTIPGNTPVLDDFENDAIFDELTVRPLTEVKKPSECSQLTNEQKKRIEENRLRALEIRRRKLDSQAIQVGSQPTEPIAAAVTSEFSSLFDHDSEKKPAEEKLNSEDLAKEEEMMSDEEILRFIGHQV